MYSEIPLAVYMPHAVSLSLSLLRTLAAPDPVLGLQCWPIGCVSGGFVGDIQPVGAYGNCLCLLASALWPAPGTLVGAEVSKTLIGHFSL